MGLDGGTKISRHDVLRRQSWDLSKADSSRSTRGGAVTGTHKRPQLDPRVAQQTKWTTCALSEQPLQPPLVADRLGNLYNKDAVLTFLLGRAGHFADAAAEHRYINQLRAGGTALEHLQFKRDVFDISLPNLASDGHEPAGDGEASSCYRCPVTDLPADRHPFSALSSCGHVFSDRALQQMRGEQQACSVCSRPFSESAVVPINGAPEQVAALAARLQLAREKREGRAAKRKGQERAALPASEASHPKRLKGSEPIVSNEPIHD